MTDFVNLKITSCQKCPNFTSQRYYTGDSFEHVEEWRCKAQAQNHQRIALYEWPESKPKIPDWCPLREQS